MPKAYRRRTRRSHLPRHRYAAAQFPFLQVALIAILLGFLLAGVYVSFTQKALNFQFFTDSASTVVGDPTIDATFINKVLRYYHSPAQGKGQALYDGGKKYHIDPAFALAFFQHESSFGTQGVAAVTHSLGNIRALSGHPQYHGYRYYATWEEGFEDWYKLIANVYVDQWGLATVDQIIPVYAPSEDNNDEGAYISSVKNSVQTWRNGRLEA